MPEKLSKIERNTAADARPRALGDPRDAGRRRRRLARGRRRRRGTVQARGVTDHAT